LEVCTLFIPCDQVLGEDAKNTIKASLTAKNAEKFDAVALIDELSLWVVNLSDPIWVENEVTIVNLD
jgi:hypothetical protein